MNLLSTVVVILMWIFATCLQGNICDEAKYSPVILIPGDGGSKIYARIEERCHSWLCFCPIGSDWSLIWLNLELWLPFMEHCLKSYFRLSYNYTDHRTYNYPGLETKIKDWGLTSSVDYLSNYHFKFATAFGPTSKHLMDHGFVQNVSLRGAPFDFRRAPNDNRDYFPRLAALIEDTYYRNNRSAVMLMSHSMGNLYVNYFSNRMPKEWRDKYIRGYIAVSAPVGGAVKSVLGETAGIRFSSLIFNMDVVRTVLRSMPSITFNFPYPQFWGTDEILARRPGRNYTLSNLKTLFEDIKNPDGWQMYQDTSKLVDPLWIPDFKVLYCVHGYDLETPESLEWTSDKAFPKTQPNIIPGPGDGTVNLRSLHGCLRWPGVKHVTYAKAEHKDILGDPRFLRDILGMLKL